MPQRQGVIPVATHPRILMPLLVDRAAPPGRAPEPQRRLGEYINM